MAGARKGGRNARHGGKKKNTIIRDEQRAMAIGGNLDKRPAVSRDLLMLEREENSWLPSSLLISPKDSQKRGERPTFQRLPESELLARARLFLPAIAEANRGLESLQSSNHAGIELTKVSDGGELSLEAEEPAESSETGVVMDLALGIVELKNDAAIAAAERALVTHGADDRTDSSSEDSDGAGDRDVPTLAARTVAGERNGQRHRSKNNKKSCKIVEL